jgi:3-oxoacyl-(acyl-carrier-protein) synthase
MIKEKVAITGIGCLCAAGLNLNECMDTLYSGKRDPAPPKGDPFYSRTSHPVFRVRSDFFREEDFREKNILRCCKLALKAVREAMTDSGLDASYFREKRVGVCIGTNVGSSMNNENFFRENREGCDPYISPRQRFYTSNPVNAVIREFETTGPFQTVVNACSAGTDALGIGAQWIREGICDAVIAGGVDELYRVTYNGFISLMVFDDAPCKPFDAKRKGLNLGEGAAMFILESETSLKQRDRSPRARVMGYGTASDAWHFTAPRPDGMGLIKAIEMAVDGAGVSTSELAFINTHGTGTRDNDRVESEVLCNLAPAVPFLSTKGYVGHTLGASGAIEAAFSVCCLERGIIPASAGFSEADPDLPASPVSENTAVHGNVAMSQTLAFGGHNSVILLGIEGDRR